jgi:DNA-binding response OmpR family regulator
MEQEDQYHNKIFRQLMDGKVIIVEDDFFSQQFYEYVMKKAGYSIEVLENADRLMESLSIDNVALIIMDINLKNTYLQGKKVDGYYLTKYIKERYLSLPVLLVTAHSPSVKGEDFFAECSADDYIIKPIIDIKYFLSKVSSLIEQFRKK